jgi:hypothetical protein
MLTKLPNTFAEFVQLGDAQITGTVLQTKQVLTPDDHRPPETELICAGVRTILMGVGTPSNNWVALFLAKDENTLFEGMYSFDLCKNPHNIFDLVNAPEDELEEEDNAPIHTWDVDWQQGPSPGLTFYKGTVTVSASTEENARTCATDKLRRDLLIPTIKDVRIKKLGK